MARFGNVNLKVRPIRLAFLVDPNSARQVRAAIQLGSTLWGGTYCPIIPLYRQMPQTWRDGPLAVPKARNVIRGYIDAFDPDVLVQFSKSVPAYVSDLKLEIVKPEEIWSHLAEERTVSPKYGIGVFEILHDVFEEHFKYKAKYPLRVVLPKLPKQHALFWASLFGEIPADLLALVRKHYSTPLEIEEPKFTIGILGELLDGNVRFPRRLTQENLVHRHRSRGRGNACAFFMDASKTEDVVDYWNLRAMGRSVMPIPKQFISDAKMHEVVVAFLKDHRVHWRHNNSVCDFASIICSRHSTLHEVQSYAKSLALVPPAGDSSPDGYFSIQHWYQRVWDEWARDKDGANPDDFYADEQSIEISESVKPSISFTPLIPKFAAEHVFHGEPRCANELSFRFYGSGEYLAETFPKFAGENFVRTISTFGAFRDYWRVGRNGLVKLVTDKFSETWEVPRAQEVVFAWLKDLGWECVLSSPGMLAKQIYKTLDGHALTLTNEKLLGLLEHMNGGSVQADGRPTKSDAVNQTRELPVGQIRSRLKGSSLQRNLCDYLITLGIFHVGLRLQCPNCVRNSWFAVDEMDTTLRCPLCLGTFAAIGHVEKGVWCYKSAGPFSVARYADGAFATLLALEFFGDHKMGTLQATPALSFKATAPGKAELEADFALFWQDMIHGEKRDGIVFGECKTYGEFKKKDFERMKYLAKTFPGAIIAFATLRKTLSKKEIAAIAKIAKRGRKLWKAERPTNPVLVLTGNELLSFQGPPYCWSEDAKERFRHMRGLLDVCNVTQQLYLNLPSWETEWHAKAERRRLKHQSKRAENGPGRGRVTPSVRVGGNNSPRSSS